MENVTSHPPETFSIFLDTDSFTAVSGSDLSFFAQIDVSKFGIKPENWYLNAHQCVNGDRVTILNGQVTPTSSGTTDNVGGQFPSVFSDYRVDFRSTQFTVLVRLQAVGLSRDTFIVFAKKECK